MLPHLPFLIKLDVEPVSMTHLSIPLRREDFQSSTLSFVRVLLSLPSTSMPSPPHGYTTFPSDADLFYCLTTSSTSTEELGINYTPPSQSSLRVGVIVFGQDQIQLSDLAAVDLLATLSRSRIGRLNAPATTLDEAVDEVDIRYVSVTGEGSFPVTSGARMPVTVS